MLETRHFGALRHILGIVMAYAGAGVWYSSVSYKSKVGMIRYFKKLQKALLKSEPPDYAPNHSAPAPLVHPVIWLLGKTGAGKTSLIRCLTGLDSATIGNGFEPCTRTAREFEYPPDDPLIKFLDTRGLGESHYDPEEDLQECRNRSHVVLVVARIDDPVQDIIARVLNKVRRLSPDTPILIVHTGVDLVPDKHQRNRAIDANQTLFENAVAAPLHKIETSMPPDALGPQAYGIEQLIELLSDITPEVALLLLQDQLRGEEKKAFAHVRSQVIRYASAAGASDLAPAVGALAVPSIQANMLRVLANQYKVAWTRRRFTEYSLALGMGALTRFGGSYLARQAAKLIPVYGQTIGAVSAGSISFATTFALGRSAAYYLYQVQHGKTINQDEVRAQYKNALAQAIRVSRKSENSDERSHHL